MSLQLQKEDDDNHPTDSERKSQRKRIVLVRHGCTFMNEYLATEGSEWGDPNFTDVFSTKDQDAFYRDSPLSEKGVRQAKQLSDELLSLCSSSSSSTSMSLSSTSSLSLSDIKTVNQIEMIAVSPLKRALQTMESGILPHVKSYAQKYVEDEKMSTSESSAGIIQGDRSNGSSGSTSTTTTYFKKSIASSTSIIDGANINIPIIALPHAAERLYLVSDLGSSLSQLSQMYPYVNFSLEFDTCSNQIVKDKEWWFKLLDYPDSADGDESLLNIQSKQRSYRNSMLQRDYEEWRPNDDRQIYSCPGEPDEVFQERMTALYKWLEEREEKTICLVSHWGVLQWLTGLEFKNCEIRVVDFDDMKCS